MHFQAIACDYDGTLAHDGRVAPETLEAIQRARASGRKVILITGRELDDLGTVFSQLGAFDLVVAENGALLYDPATRSEHPLCPAPPGDFAIRLRERGVPVSRGRRIIASERPHDATILDLIRELHLDMRIAYNRESVMVLPAGIDKGTGLAAALAELGLRANSVVGFGDAENDQPFLRLCGFAVAVANAIPAIKEDADLVSTRAEGAGVVEVIDRILATDSLP